MILRDLLAALLLVLAVSAGAEVLPERGAADARLRIAHYRADEVYRLYAYVGYQIDLQFEAGESFVGLGAGDIEGIAFVAQGNHLFVKPKAARVITNLTVLTDRRQYQFDYVARSRPPDPATDEVIYAVRFLYPAPPKSDEAIEEVRTHQVLAAAGHARARNIDYGFCGNPAVKPIAAWDDGVHTRLRFGGRAELPAIFVRNEDGTESLVNFSMEEGDVIVHRVAHRFIVRRGKLTGCIVNQAFTGSGESLRTQTVSDEVERATREPAP